MPSACRAVARRAKAGGAKRDRTADLLNAMQALSQLSYGPYLGNSLSGARTLGRDLHAIKRAIEAQVSSSSTSPMMSSTSSSSSSSSARKVSSSSSSISSSSSAPSTLTAPAAAASSSASSSETISTGSFDLDLGLLDRDDLGRRGAGPRRRGGDLETGAALRAQRSDCG